MEDLNKYAGMTYGDLVLKHFPNATKEEINYILNNVVSFFEKPDYIEKQIINYKKFKG